MFGTQSLSQQSNDDPAMLDNVKQLAQEPASAIVPPSPPPIDSSQVSSPFTPTTVSSASDDSQSQQAAPVDPPSDEHRAEPAEGFSSSPLPTTDPAQSDTATMPIADDNDQSSTPPPTSDTTTTTPDPTMQSSSTPAQDSPTAVTTPATPMQAPDQEHLAGLKKQALEHLEPLADHVEGTPEETFKTTMMMIQANDNHTLLEKALDAAKKIEDDKVRAKAMLDVINEINYFSQNQSDSDQ